MEALLLEGYLVVSHRVSCSPLQVENPSRVMLPEQRDFKCHFSPWEPLQTLTLQIKCDYPREHKDTKYSSYELESSQYFCGYIRSKYILPLKSREKELDLKEFIWNKYINLIVRDFVTRSLTS